MNNLSWSEYKAYREGNLLEVSVFRYFRYRLNLEGLDTPP